MALISCPECGKQISDVANSCPHCGFPMSKQTAANISEDKAVKHQIDSQQGFNSKSGENPNSSDANSCAIWSVIILIVAFVMLFRGCDSDSDSSSGGYGEYTSPSGKRQMQYQGSREQQRDLDLIDSYFGY